MGRVRQGLLAAVVPSLVLLASATTVAAAPPPRQDVEAFMVERSCGEPAPGEVACLSVQRKSVRKPNVAPNAAVPGYSPADLRSAYKINGTGSASTTIAITIAYDNPKAESDLAVYRAQFGLPPCTTANGCFRKINQNGHTSPLPQAHSGWGGESSLDLQMASAICPNCKLLLVESWDASDNIYAAVDQAVAQGAKFVNMSWGGPEWENTEPQYDSAYFNKPGVVFTAASGDDGYAFGPMYPASSQYATAVGGTSLHRNWALGRGWQESAWGGAGSGCSTSVAKPAFQSGISACGNKRAMADVAAVADPATGVAVYHSYGAPGWVVFGGTSVAAPIVAAVYALGGMPQGGDRPNAYPYARPGSLFDVTSGSNGSCAPAVLCNGQFGWDGPTGLGSPNGTGAFRYLCVGKWTPRGTMEIGQRAAPVAPGTPDC